MPYTNSTLIIFKDCLINITNRKVTQMAKFDFESLTIEEVETIEQISGSPIDALMDDSALKGKSLKAVIYVMKKRENANFTIADAAKISFKEAMEMLQPGEPDPKETSEN